MYLDYATIFVKAGNGGNGIVSFYTEKYVAKGGPDGGDGGKGGDIIFVADNSISTLVNFRYNKHFRAENGSNGGPKNQTGKSGSNLVIKVPCGTIIKDKKTGGILADMFYDGSTVTLFEGGLGGKGNARFANSKRKAPNFSQQGEPSIERQLVLELKTVADVGLVGFPNVGKSTLLSVTTSARPKIANYHFTTLNPNLGVVKYHHDSFVVADIPGLIEGASDGLGLGHNFLKHIERVRLIVHVVDISASDGRDPVEDFKIINDELAQFSQVLASKPQIVCVNKIDLNIDKKTIEKFAKKIKKPVIAVSAITNEGITQLLDEIYKVLKTLPKPQPIEFEKFEYEKTNPDEFIIEKLDEGYYQVTGGLIDILSRQVVFDDYHSFAYFQKILKEKGVIKKLRKEGAVDGDTIQIKDFEFELVD